MFAVMGELPLIETTARKQLINKTIFYVCIVLLLKLHRDVKIVTPEYCLIFILIAHF